MQSNIKIEIDLTLESISGFANKSFIISIFSFTIAIDKAVLLIVILKISFNSIFEISLNNDFNFIKSDNLKFY